MLTKRVQPWRSAIRQGLAELPGVHRRRADIAGLAGLDDIVQRFERLLDRRLVVPAMDLVEVDIIHAEAAEALIDLDHDRFARQAGAIGSGSHAAVDFGRDDDLVAPGEVIDRTAEDLLAPAERIAVRRVEEIDAGFERPLDERPALFLAEAPGMIDRGCRRRSSCSRGKSATRRGRCVRAWCIPSPFNNPVASR